MVTDALSRMPMVNVSHIEEAKKNLVRDVHRLARSCVRLEDYPNGILWFIITSGHHWCLR